MFNFDLVQACTDLGVNVDGAKLAPELILEKIDTSKIKDIYKCVTKPIIKSIDKKDKKKNLKFVNLFNKDLYSTCKKSIQSKRIPLTIGGDHSLSIGSALASQDVYNNLGLIWFDAHADFNTFSTTITGNIHGVPFATIAGCNRK